MEQEIGPEHRLRRLEASFDLPWRLIPNLQ
jgi:hypothetical protein